MCQYYLQISHIQQAPNNYYKELPIELIDVIKYNENVEHTLIAPKNGYYILTRGSGAHNYATWGITNFLYRITGPYKGNESGGEQYFFYATANQTILTITTSGGRYHPCYILYRLTTNNAPIVTKIGEASSSRTKVTFTPTIDNVFYSSLTGGEYIYQDQSTYASSIYRTDNGLTYGLRTDMQVFHQMHTFFNVFEKNVEYNIPIQSVSSRGDTTVCSIQY